MLSDVSLSFPLSSVPLLGASEFCAVFPKNYSKELLVFHKLPHFLAAFPPVTCKQ